MVKHYSRQDKRSQGKLLPIARQMRQEPTPAEGLLWEYLRARKLCGYKFYRQYSIDRFIVDYACTSASLIIEIDGEIHLQQAEADQEREQILSRLGFRVVRFTNTQVLEQTELVLQQILTALAGIPSLKTAGFAVFGEGTEG